MSVKNSVLGQFWLLLSCTLVVPALASPQEIYLVRHAEKMHSNSKDPELSVCGRAQAKAMAKLIPAALESIYHSGYQRTQQTAEYIALSQATATLHSYNPADLATLAKTILQLNSPVLVVGHSNTTPDLIHLLSQLEGPLISEQDYGVVYQLKRVEQAYHLDSFRIEQPTICSSSST